MTLHRVEHDVKNPIEPDPKQLHYITNLREISFEETPSWSLHTIL